MSVTFVAELKPVQLNSQYRYFFRLCFKNNISRNFFYGFSLLSIISLAVNTNKTLMNYSSKHMFSLYRYLNALCKPDLHKPKLKESLLYGLNVTLSLLFPTVQIHWSVWHLLWNILSVLYGFKLILAQTFRLFSICVLYFSFLANPISIIPGSDFQTCPNSHRVPLRGW